MITDTRARRTDRDLPIDPRTTKRGPPARSGEQMDSEIDPNTLEEIRALETRLAVLKQKAKAAATPAIGRTVSFLFDSSSGEDLALPEEGPFDCEDTSTHHERSHIEDGRPLLHDQGRRHGQVHPHPLPRERASEDYKLDGPHFGNKPIEHKHVCCGQDYDAATNDIFIASEEFELTIGNPRINYECTGTRGQDR